MPDVCVPAIERRTSPLSRNASPLSRRATPFAMRASPLARRESVFGRFCVNIFKAIFQDGSYYTFQNGVQLIF